MAEDHPTSPLPDRIIGLYERHARAFDRDRGKSLFEKPWLDRFLDLVPEGGSVLDIGCGSGEPIARHLIEPGRGRHRNRLIPNPAVAVPRALPRP